MAKIRDVEIYQESFKVFNVERKVVSLSTLTDANELRILLARETMISERLAQKIREVAEIANDVASAEAFDWDAP